jgi:hypothetical protein
MAGTHSGCLLSINVDADVHGCVTWMCQMEENWTGKGLEENGLKN